MKQDLLKLEIGERIDFIRKQNGMSKDKFAKFINVTPQHLGKVISGETGLSVEKIIELSEKTGYPTDYILLGKKESFEGNINKLIEEAEKQMQAAYGIIRNMSVLLKQIS